MSATTYNELRNAAKRFTRVTVIDEDFDTMIEMAEAEIYKALRVREMLATYSASLVVGDRTLALPTRFLEAIPKGCYTETNGVRYPIDYRLDAVDNRNLSGRPQQFKVTSEIEFDVNPDSAYSFSMEHFTRPAKLTESASTNAVIAAYPEVFLYGILWAVNEYAKELELADREKRKLDIAIGSANATYKSSAFGPEPSFSGVQRSNIRYVKMRGR